MIWQIVIGIVDIVPEYSKYTPTVKGVVIFQAVLSSLILAIVAQSYRYRICALRPTLYF